MANYMDPFFQQQQRAGDIMMWGDQRQREIEAHNMAVAKAQAEMEQQEAFRNAVGQIFGGGGMSPMPSGPSASSGPRNALMPSNARASAGLRPSGPTANPPQNMENIFNEAASTYGVPVSLLHRVAQVESNFNANALSPAGAMGVMQLMPGTAKDLGVSNPWDVRENVFGGAKYLKMMMDRYGGDESKALAAYNAGPRRVDSGKALPRETQAYLRATGAGAGNALTGGGVQPSGSNQSDQLRQLGLLLLMTGQTAQGTAMLQAAQSAQNQGAFTLGEGQVRYGPDGEILAQGPPKQGEFGQPIKAVGPDGKPALVQVDKNGNVRTLNGFTPPPEKGMTIETGPDGVTRVTTGGESGGGKGYAKEFFKKLPEQYEQAKTSQSALTRVNQITELLNRAGKDVTGLRGTINRAFAPYASALGLNTEAMTDAEIFQSLTSMQAGSLRLAIVGPGPVSNYEQGILQAVSGGKLSAAEGVRRIMNVFRDQAKKEISDLNKRIDSIKKIPGNEDIDAYYPKIELPSFEEPPMPGAFTGTDGKWYVEQNGQVYRIDK